MVTQQTSEWFGSLIGASPVMKKVFSLAEKAAAVDLPTLITGETGTGKDLLAKEIHRRSKRAGKPYVALNTGMISKELMGSELFGHVKGAFTGASNDKSGRFLEADGGTLFLDEIGTMEEAVQVALLRVLETGAFRPVGGQEDKHVDVRVIAATNIDLHEAVKNGLFRPDLLHRFEVLSIRVPPLRERLEDLPALAHDFLEHVNREFDLQVSGFAPGVLDVLRNHPWTGNVRELRNSVAQAAIMAENGLIEIRHLPRRVQGDRSPTKSSQSSLNERAKTHGAEPSRSEEEGVYVPFGVSLEEAQRAFVLRTLEYCDNNKTRAARLLGLSRKTLYDRLGKWDHP
ncbi:MAG: sigma-54 dependent transcriptional regulator [Candidatus Hydrogenedentota bacterium]